MSSGVPTKLEVSTAFEKIGGTGQTDGHTYRQRPGATLYAAFSYPSHIPRVGSGALYNKPTSYPGRVSYEATKPQQFCSAVFCVVCFFWVVFSFCSVSVFNLSSVLYFPACTNVNGSVYRNFVDVSDDMPLRIYSLYSLLVVTFAVVADRPVSTWYAEP